MKAAVCYGDSVVKYEEINEPKVGYGEVKVKIKACGICRSDVPRVLNNTGHSYPAVFGHEASGVVCEISEGVPDLKVGDRVAIVPLVPCHKCVQCRQGRYALCSDYSFVGTRQQGTMAEYVVVPYKNVVKLPYNMTFEQGALFEPATVAIHAYYQNQYEPNGNVAIIGGGTVGIFAVQWAKILGCKKVIVFGRDKKHLETSLKYGADGIISTLDENFIEQAEICTDGEGFDYVFETAGSDVTIKYAFQLGAKKSHICMVGTPTSELKFTIKEWEEMNRKECYITGSWMSYSSPFPGVEWEMTRKYFEEGSLKFTDEMFFKKFNLRDVQTAFNLFKDTETKVRGRVLLTVD